MLINLLVGGPEAVLPSGFYEWAQTQPNWVGADQGAVRLLAHGITPCLAVGDFDSSTAQEIAMVQQQIKRTVIDPQKDDITDTEMALRYIRHYFPGVTQVNIFGATGARMDQLLANLLFVLKPEFEYFLDKLKLYDRNNTVSFYRPGQYTLVKEQGMKYLAFVPLTPVQGLELPDEKYRLPKTDFLLPISLSSNEFIGDKGHFTFSRGVVAVIQSCD